MYVDIGFETDQTGLEVILAASDRLKDFKTRLRGPAGQAEDFALLIKLVAYPWLALKPLPAPQGRYRRSLPILDHATGRTLSARAIEATVWVRHSELTASASPDQTVRLVAHGVIDALETPAFGKTGEDAASLRAWIQAAVASQ